MKTFPTFLTLTLTALLCGNSNAIAGRLTRTLDGTWQIADGKSPDEIPTLFTHTVPVPGLANLATPSFPDVDQFISRENLANKIRANLIPPGG